MDRNIVYPGSIPLDTDLLATNRNAMVALGALIAATLGQQTVVDGLAVTATSPASMNVQVAPGVITSITTLDQTAYGSLAADAVDPLVKMGVNISPTFLACAAPSVAGDSIDYLVEAAFQESDVDPVVLPYYNAANPTQPYAGPANSGASQATQRIQRVLLQLKAGTAAATGAQAAPTPDAGFVGLAVVTVAYGQTQVTSGNIAALPTAPSIPYKLPSLRPGFAAQQAFASSGLFVVPGGVTTVKVTVVGGGGAGGTHSSLPSGGGGAGGQAVRIVGGLTPGLVIPVTVGAGGTAPAAGAPGQGGPGGSSSFGAYVSATGGQGGGGGTVVATNAGGGGGGVGGDIDYGASFGTDGIPSGQRGGDGGGPGGGRGTSGLIPGIAANGFGGGGGGGGASAPGGGTGAVGGNGFAGLVIVEF